MKKIYEKLLMNCFFILLFTAKIHSIIISAIESNKLNTKIKKAGSQKLYGLYLIAVLIVTGGAIAFIGDRLGTKIGKKRLSLFGLRPRHTSNIITVITGFIITALTIGTMAIMSENVRTALFGMEELNANLESKQLQLDELSDELIVATNEYQKANEDLKKSKDEIENLKTEQIELKEESDRLKEGNEELEIKNAKLISDNENLSTTNENLTINNSKLISDNETLTNNNDKLQDENKKLENHNEQLRDGIVAIREGDIIFRAGEILASGVIKGNRDPSEIVKDIDQLADIATSNVSRRIGNNGDESSVWIYQPELSEAVKEISSSKNDVVLRITAAGNLMRGEPVRSSLEIFTNNKIYSKDEFIIAMAFDLKEGVNAEQVVRNFLSEVNKKAVSKGVLPDPITGSVGVIEGTQFYQVVDAVSKAKGLIVLTALARDETTTIGPLRLNIKLEQSKEG